LASKTTAFDEVMQNNVHYAVKCQSWSPLSLPSKSQNG